MIHVRRRVIFLCATALLAACSEGSDSLTPPVAQDRVIQVNDCKGPATSVDPATFSPSRVYTSDDQWAEIARTTPGGFAGILYGMPDQIPTIMLTDTTQEAAAKAALKPLLAQLTPSFDVDKAIVGQARWNSDQLLNWYYYLLAQPIWVENNVTSSGIDETANRIRINTADSTSQAAFASRLEGMGLPCDLVQVGVMPPGIEL